MRSPTPSSESLTAAFLLMYDTALPKHSKIIWVRRMQPDCVPHMLCVLSDNRRVATILGLIVLGFGCLTVQASLGYPDLRPTENCVRFRNE